MRFGGTSGGQPLRQCRREMAKDRHDTMRATREQPRRS